MKAFLLSLVILGSVALSWPADAVAQGLVPCTGLDCDFCDIADMTNGIINWLFGFLTLCAVLVFAWAGIKLVTLGGDQAAMEYAKARLTYVIIGFLLMLASWLIVDTILKGLTQSTSGEPQGLEFWGTFEVGKCGEQVEPDPFNDSLKGLAAEDHEELLPRLTTTGYINLQNEYQMSCAAFGEIQGGGQSCDVVASPAGQLCFTYSGGECFDVVNVAEQPGYEYAALGCVSSAPTQFIELTPNNLRKRVSTSYTLAEVVVLKNSSHFGQYAHISPAAVVALQQLRNLVGQPFEITSGFRSPGYNRHLKSSNTGVANCSQHQFGTGFDFIPPSGVSQQQISAYCRQAGANFTKDDYNVHTHCDWR